MTTPTQPHTDTSTGTDTATTTGIADPAHQLDLAGDAVGADTTDVAMVGCSGCGWPIPRRYLIGADYCSHCADIRSRVHRLITWKPSPDQPLYLIPADPLAALHIARAAANQLIRTTVRHARNDGASWKAIGDAIGLTASQTQARYRQP